MNFGLLTAIFFPRRCAGCGVLLRDGVLCGACYKALPTPRPFFCACCGTAGSACNPRTFYHKGSAASYDHPLLRSLVHTLKFRGVRAAAEPLADFLSGCAPHARMLWSGHIVIPLPLATARLRVRGFNQSALIAERFAAYASLPFRTDCLIRIRHARPQSETKNARERQENIRGCFAPTERILTEGKRFILIDDVTTSGATLYEAAMALKAGGAARVVALTVAQA